MQLFSIILVGDELLCGEAADTDSRIISKFCDQKGLQRQSAILLPDQIEAVQKCLAFVAEFSSFVFVCSGPWRVLEGSSRAAAAKYFDCKLLNQVYARERVQTGIKNTNRPVTEDNKNRVESPQMCRVFETPAGDLRGYSTTTGDTVFFFLPADPVKVAALLPHIDCFPVAFKKDSNRTLHFTFYGITDQQLEKRIFTILDEAGIPADEYQITTEYGVHSVFINDINKKGYQAVRDRVTQNLNDGLISLSGQSLHEVLLKTALDKKVTLATAESCTSGLIGSLLAELPGSSAVFCGGIIAYSNIVKQDLLNVNKQTLLDFGAVSPECAVEMARGASTAFNCSLTVAVTGIAGPTGGTPVKPTGTVIFATADTDGNTDCQTVRFSGSRETVRRTAANHALFLLLQRIRKTYFDRPFDE